MSRLKLKFIFAATASLSQNIDFFEQNKVHVHHSRDKMQDILYTQLKKCVQSKFLQYEEDGGVVRKTAKELLQVEVSDQTMLKRERIFLGREVSDEMKDLDLRPNSPQVAWLMDMAKTFHTEVSSFLIKYFTTGLKSDTLENMAGLSPSNQTKKTTSKQIKGLASTFSKIVDNIQFIGGTDQLEEEVDNYLVDEDIKEITHLEYEEYWEQVGKLTSGGEEWTKYSVLPRFARAMATKHNDTSEVERIFSLMNHIHMNKQKNHMGQGLLDSCMHIKSSVESEENRKSCEKCREGKAVDHCHCKVAKITGELKINCKKAWSLAEKAQREASAQKEMNKEEAKEKKDKEEEIEKTRLTELKERLATRNYFYPSNKMQPVYTKTPQVLNLFRHLISFVYSW